ncbi:MAG: ATPase domain-containing protein [Candidatus Anstonellales archaeon]
MNNFSKSGIRGFDELLEGKGFMKGSLIALSGPTGVGKSTFAMQFLVNGAVLYTEPGVYITIEGGRDSLLLQMNAYNWELDRLEKEKSVLILDYPIEEVDQFLTRNSAVKDLVESVSAERVVIDSILPLALMKTTEEERQSMFINLASNIKSWGATTIVITEDSPVDSTVPQTRYHFENFSDTWIYMSYDRQGKDVSREIEIVKAKGVKHYMGKRPIEISKEGVSVALPEWEGEKNKKILQDKKLRRK